MKKEHITGGSSKVGLPQAIFQKFHSETEQLGQKMGSQD